MTLRDTMTALLMAGWLRVRPVTDPMIRDRASAGGAAAAITVRQLSMLLGNALTADMVQQRRDFDALLRLLSSAAWIEGRISQRARYVAFEIRAANGPQEIAEWAQPWGLDGLNDGVLRGTPGGEARQAVMLYLRECIGQPAASAQIRQTAAWRAHLAASSGFERPASVFVGALEAMIAAGGVPNRERGVAAIQREYAAELAWLRSDEGRQFALYAAPATMIAVQVPQLPDASRIALGQTFDVRDLPTSLGQPRAVPQLPAAIDLSLGASGRLEGEVGQPPLADEAPAAPPPAAPPAAEPEPAKKKTKKKNSAALIGGALTAASLLAAILKRKRGPSWR